LSLQGILGRASLPRNFNARAPAESRPFLFRILRGLGSGVLLVLGRGLSRSVNVVRLSKSGTDERNNAKARERSSAFHKITTLSASLCYTSRITMLFLRPTSDATLAGKAALFIQTKVVPNERRENPGQSF
jgi:hypothetical protein